MATDFEWGAFWIAFFVVAFIAVIAGSMLYNSIYEMQQDTARIKELQGIDRCIYICNMKAGTTAYNTAGPQPCYEKCENNYQALNQIDYNNVMANAKK